MGRFRASLLSFVAVCRWSGDAIAQRVTRDDYYHLLPAAPVLVRQTPASERLHLFGDRALPGYRDVNPADGIDDQRAAHLLALAEHFSPIIRPNNVSLPRHPYDFFSGTPELLIDRWENGRRVASDSIPLDARMIVQAGAPMEEGEGDAAARRLRRLYARHAPRADRPRLRDPVKESEEILFIDLPGQDPESWMRQVKGLSRDGTRIFAHPFLYEEETAADRRFLLVMQYWFFFLMNNSANNHEGDWEHINVHITTRHRATPGIGGLPGAMTEAELVRLLRNDVPLDSTVIAAVEYHFHHLVMTLDYVNARVLPNTVQPVHEHPKRSVWEDRAHITNAIRQRITAANGRLATHPFVFLGGNHKGPGELLDLVPRFARSLRRNSDGAYPFPGTWQAVGPLGLTEQVHGHVVPPLVQDGSAPWHQLIEDPDYITYRADRIDLLPDWERLEGLVESSDAALAQWAWMLMPVHMGFPAVASIGAGALKHVDMGNIAPHAPPFKAQWNRVGLSKDREQYDPSVLRTPVSPTTPWALLNNGWGVLNLPLAGLGLMPGWNVLIIQAAPFLAGTMHVLGAPPPKTYTTAPLPHRFTTQAQGVVWGMGGNDLARLVPDPAGTSSELRVVAEPGARLWMSLFFRDRFGLENTFSVQSSRLVRGAGEARLQERMLTGGARYTPRRLALFDDAVHLYLRGGYGWLWMKAYDVRGAGVSDTTIRIGTFPTVLPTNRWWPNIWYGGFGFEAFTPPHRWLFGGMAYGIRIESTAYSHRVPANDATTRSHVAVRRGDVSISLVTGW